MAFTYSAGVITQANTASQSISAVASGGAGLLDLTVTSSASYSAGDLAYVTATTSYNGIYLIDSIPNGTTIRISDTTLQGVQNAFGSTETGTVTLGDADYSGLTGLTGVTTETSGEVTIYDIGTNRLVLAGTSLICGNGVYEQVLFREPANHDNHKIEISGIVTAGELLADPKQYRFNYGQACFKEDAITTGDQQPFLNNGQGSTGTQTTFFVSGTGQFYGYGQTLALSGSIASSPTSVFTMENCVVYAYQVYFFSASPGLNLTDTNFYTKVGNWSLVTTPNTFDNVGGTMASENYLGGSTSTPTGTIPINNVPELPSGFDILRGGRTSASPAVLISFRNCFLGSNYGYGSTSGRYYTSELLSDFTVTTKDLAGNNLTAKTYYIGASGTDQTISYTGTSSTQTFTLREVTQAGGTSLSSDTRYDKDQDGTDLIDLKTCVFGYSIINNPDVSVKGNGIKNFNQSAVVDVSNTESDKATVDAYPFSVSESSGTITITGDSATLQSVTAQQVYDVLFSYLFDNFGTYTSPLVTRNGNDLNFGSYNVVWDYISLTGNATTTGNFTFTNGSVVIGSRTDASGTINTALLTAPNIASGASVMVLLRQQFLVSASDIDTVNNTINLGADINGYAPAFNTSTANRHTLININKAAGATLPTSSEQIVDTGTYRILSEASGVVQIEVTEGSGAITFSDTGTDGGAGRIFVATCETRALEGVLPSTGVSEALVLPNGTDIRFKAIHQNVSGGIRTSTVLIDEILTWSDTTGATYGGTLDATGSENLWTDVNRIANLASYQLEDTVIDNAGNEITSVTSVGDGSLVSGLTFALEGNGFVQVNAASVTVDSVNVNGALYAGDLILWGVYQLTQLNSLYLASNTTIEVEGLSNAVVDNVEIDNTSSSLFQVYGMHLREKNGRPIVYSSTTGSVVPNVAIRGNAGAFNPTLSDAESTALTNTLKITDNLFAPLGKINITRPS